MNDQKEVENIVDGTSNDTASPTVEQQVPTEQLENQPTGDVQPEGESTNEEVTDEKSDSTLKVEKDLKPVEKRIHKLVDERDREKERAESLAKQVEDLVTQLSGGSHKQDNNFQPTIEPGAEITPEQYQNDINRRADSIVQLRLEQNRVIDNINKETQESLREYPELDPASEIFDKDLSDAITASVKAQVTANPTSSVKKLVTQLMKPYKKAVEKNVAAQTETITKQVAETALRPSQVKGEEKAFETLTIEEMEKQLGKVY